MDEDVERLVHQENGADGQPGKEQQQRGEGALPGSQITFGAQDGIKHQRFDGGDGDAS